MPVDRDWAARRGEAALAKARAMEAAAAAESAQAAELLAGFVEAVKAAGVPPVALMAATFPAGRAAEPTLSAGTCGSTAAWGSALTAPFTCCKSPTCLLPDVGAPL